MKHAKERQVIVIWHDMEEEPDSHPPIGQITIATVSGKGRNILFDHALTEVEWYDDGLGFGLTNAELDEFVVHAWCDLEPYGV